MCGNLAIAEELAQEVWLRVFLKADQFKGKSAFSTWLNRIVINTVLMERRGGKIDAVPLDEQVMSGAGTDDGSIIRKEYGAEDLGLRGIPDRLLLTQAIEELPESGRNILILHDLRGYKHEEIARMRVCSTGNSKSQLHRTRRRLKEIIREKMRTR